MNDLTAALGYQFDATQVEIADYSPVPEGEYVAMITGASLDDTKSGGKMLTFDFTIQGSAADGRVIKDRANIVNQNQTAEKIGKETLAKICKAIGIAQPRSTTEFPNKRLKIKVVVEQGSGTYVNKYGEEKPHSAQNVVKGYYPINGAPAQAAPVAAPTVSQAEAPKPVSGLPWAK